MPGFPATGEFGVKLTPGVGAPDYFTPFQPTTYEREWAPRRERADGGIQRDGLDHQTLRWNLLTQSQFGKISRLHAQATATQAGKLYVRTWNEEADAGGGLGGAMQEFKCVSTPPAGTVDGQVYRNVRWQIRNLGIQ